jgi:hypothetical protein
MWAWLAWLVIDQAVLIGLPGANEQATMDAGRSVGRALIACLVWTAYMRQSRRVAATFVRDGSTPLQAPAVPAPLPTQTPG